MISVGEHAPEFTLASTKGSFTLAQHQGQKHALLIFYPKDNTSG